MPQFVPKARQVKRFTPRRVNFRTLELAFRAWRPMDRSLKGADRTVALKATEMDLGQLWEAFKFMRYAHSNHVRPDGTVVPTQFRKAKRFFGRLNVKYEEHPFNAALYAAQSGCDLRTIIAAMLHDCVEDQQVRIGEIRDRFGSDVSGMVSKLSTPRLVMADTPDAHLEYVKVKLDGKEVTKEIHVVYPESPYYHELAVKNQEKNLFKDSLNRKAIIQFQANRIFGPVGEDFTKQDFNTILVKQFEGLHNLQTMENMPEEDLIRRVSKSVSYAMFSFDRLNPAFMRSVPEKVKKVLQRLDDHYRSFFAKPAEDSQWWRRLRPRAWLNWRNLLEVPVATDDCLNIHECADPSKPRRTLGHTFEVGFPISMVGQSEHVVQGLKREMERQFQAHFGDQVKINTGASLLPIGLSTFHFFKVDMSQVEKPKDVDTQDWHFQKLLKPALAQTLARFHVDPLLELQAKKKDRMLNPLDGNAYYMHFPGDAHHVSLFLPHDHYGGPDAAAEIAQVMDGIKNDPELKLMGVASGVGHPCSTFHTVELKFKSGRKNAHVYRGLTSIVGLIQKHRFQTQDYRRWSISTRAGHAVSWVIQKAKQKFGRAG